MDAEEIAKFEARVKSMRADIEEFSVEFEKLSDAQLEAMILSQREKADEASWKADSAETALQLRKLSAVFKHFPHS